jgi:hypothetical protein
LFHHLFKDSRAVLEQLGIFIEIGLKGRSFRSIAIQQGIGGIRQKSEGLPEGIAKNAWYRDGRSKFGKA